MVLSLKRSNIIRSESVPIIICPIKRSRALLKTDIFFKLLFSPNTSRAPISPPAITGSRIDLCGRRGISGFIIIIPINSIRDTVNPVRKFIMVPFVIPILEASSAFRIRLV